MNIINKKTILFFSISTLMISGCVSKQELQIKPQNMAIVKVKSLKNKNIWNKKLYSNIKKEDCIDCYATPIDYSKPPSVTSSMFTKVSSNKVFKTYSRNKIVENKHYGNYGYIETASDTVVKRNNYINRKVVSAPRTINSSYGSYSTGTAIQVGAFSKYAGAKTYVNKYNALVENYTVAIKTGRKNNKLLYRVRIEGFKNNSEAKNFMKSNGISDAFLVR